MSMSEKEAIERALQEETRMAERQTLLRRLWKAQKSLDSGGGIKEEDSATVNERREPMLSGHTA